MTKSIKEVKNLSSFRSHYSKKDLWFILPVVIVLLSGLFFLSDFNEGKRTLTGMATYTGAMPTDYFWNVPPATEDNVCNGGCKLCSPLGQSTNCVVYCVNPNSIVFAYDAGPLLSAFCANDKNSDGNAETIYCSDTQTGAVKSGTLEGDKFFCQSNQWKVCKSDTKGPTSDSKFYCDGSKWQACNVTGKQITDGTNQYVCNNNAWIPCTNKFCWMGVLDSQKFENTKNLITNLPGFYVSQQGDVVDSSLSLSNKLFYNVLSQSETELYFKYKGNNYKVVLTAPNYYDGTAKLEVKTIDDVLKGNPADIKATNESFPYFAPVQISASLEGDEAPEVYVNAYGYFTKDSIQVLVVVNPKLDLDEFGSGEVFLSSKNAQEFILGEKRSVYLMETQGNYILFLDKKQYTNQSGTHYLESKAKSEYVIYNRFTSEYKSSDLKGLPFAIVKLTKYSEGIKNTYEETFTLSKTFNIGNNKIIKVCADDTKSLKQSLEVCDKDENKQFSLQNKGLNVSGNILFWYLQPVGDELKEGKAFYLVSLLLNALPVTETANTFSNNLVQSKRLGIDVDKNYYLLSHAVTTYLDFPSLLLADISNKDLPQYKAEGDQEKVVFNLPLKRQVNIKLKFEPALNFELSSKTVTNNPVNLIEALQTSLSTYGSVQLTSPEGIGNVAVDTTDIATLQDKMKISYLGKPELIFKQPTVLGSGNEKALFYYNSFTSAGLNTFIKYADIYLYYNLTLSPATHTFDDEKFILPLVKGRKIAFGLEGNYYLLGYSEPWSKDSASGFSAAKMVLTSLDGATKYDAQATENGIAFVVGKRKIEMIINTTNNLVTFKGVTALEAAKTTFNPAEDFSIELPASNLPTEKNVIEIKGVGKFYNCDSKNSDSGYTTFKTKFLLCQEPESGGEVIETEVYVNKPLLLSQNNLMVWFKGMANKKKTITIQIVENLTNTPKQTFGWMKLVEKLQLGKSPILAWNGQLLELTGGDVLDTFNLKPVPSGEPYLITMHSNEEGANNGTIAVNENLLFFQQVSQKSGSMELSMEVLQYKLLTSKGFNLTEDTISFISSLGASPYSINAVYTPVTKGEITYARYEIQINGPSFDKELGDNIIIFQGLVTPAVSRTILLSNKETVKVELIEDEDETETKIYTPMIKK